MPKVVQGRLFGQDGIGSYTAEELDGLADEHLHRIDDPKNTDDPKWLKRRATRLRKLAHQKEKALEHKVDQR